MSEWRDISTAPKDGTRVLAYSDPRDYPFIVHFSHVGRYTSSPKMWIGHPYGAMEDNDLSGWMPLPPTPAKARP